MPPKRRAMSVTRFPAMTAQTSFWVTTGMSNGAPSMWWNGCTPGRMKTGSTIRVTAATMT